MKEMKNIKGSSKGGQSVPDSVDGVCGHEEIVDKFKEVYEELYNSAPTVDNINNIKNTLNNLIGPECMAEVDRVTGSVQKMMQLLKPRVGGEGDRCGQDCLVCNGEKGGQCGKRSAVYQI